MKIALRAQRLTKQIQRLTDQTQQLFDKKLFLCMLFVAMLAAMIVVPFFANAYIVGVIQYAMFFMLLAMGLNIIVGFCGLCDLGYAAKFAIGAYTTALLVRVFGWNFWLSLPVTILVAIILGIMIGAPTLKLRSDYLAVVTLGFAEIVRITVRNLDITGAATGIHGIPRPSIFGFELRTVTHWYYVFLILVILFIFFSYRIKYSRFGRALSYIREDEDAAKAMGVNTTLYKLYAYILGGVFGGIAGSFFAMQMRSVSPGSFDFMQSANILLAVILGGMGKIPGVIVGAAFFAIFPEIFRDIPLIGDARMLWFGLLLVIVMIKRPQGLWPERKQKGK